MPSRSSRKTAPSASVQTGFCALYIRVSTADQGERFSPASQEKRLREKAAREGKLVREDYIFRDFHTGKSTERPGFDKLRKLVQKRLVDSVFVFDVSRFARNTVDALLLHNEFKRVGTKLDFCEMPFEDTAAGRLGFTQMAAIAEFFGEKIIEDSRRGAIQKLQLGKLDGGKAAYGLLYNTQTDELEIDPNSIKPDTVLRIFKWRAQRMAVYKMVKILNEERVPTYSGGLWRGVTIHQMLRNPVYMGKYIRRGIEVPCPAIVPAELWHAVQKVCDESRAQHIGRPTKKYLLSGYLWCGKCGKRYTINVRTYQCGNIDRHPYKRLCDAPGVGIKRLELAAWQEIWSIVTNWETLIKLGRAYHESLEKPECSAALEAEKAMLTARVKITQQMMQDQYIGYSEGGADIRQWKKRIEQIERELAAARQVLPMPPADAVEAFSREIAAGPEPTTFQARREILDSLVDLRMRYFEGELEIEGKIPIPAASSESTTSGRRKCINRQCDQVHSFRPRGGNGCC
jgi:DNA invertase Pin-like site-specific DNA recombinase